MSNHIPFPDLPENFLVDVIEKALINELSSFQSLRALEVARVVANACYPLIQTNIDDMDVDNFEDAYATSQSECDRLEDRVAELESELKESEK